MSAKDIYREFSRNEPSLPVFSRDWWLDATAGPDNWNVALVQRAGEVVAAMPYALRRRYGMRMIGQPRLTQKLGPWIRAAEGKPATRLRNENALMQALIDQLPDFDYFMQNWHNNRTNWLPFYWNGFQQSTRYTNVLNELSDTEKLWAGFDNNARTNCKKASDRFGLRVRDDLPLDALFALHQATFAHQGMQLPYSDAFVHRLDAACAQRGCRKFFIAEDSEGRHHAGTYFVWDEGSAYGLMSGADHALRNSGAASLCIWEVIKHASKVTQQLDFAGSMSESIGRFFLGFGVTQVPYFGISKTPSRLLRMWEALSMMGDRTGRNSRRLNNSRKGTSSMSAKEKP